MRFIVMMLVFLVMIWGVYNLILRMFGGDALRTHTAVQRAAFVAVLLSAAIATFYSAVIWILFATLRVIVAFLLLYVLSLFMKWRERGKQF